MNHDLLDQSISLFSNLKQRQFMVAYSGGLDSHVLLHVMSRVPNISLRAVYVDHGLQEDSLWWGQHCQRVCSELSIPFQLISLNLQVPSGKSLEAYAREERYAAFSELLNEGEVLLTGHHQNDQAETLLIQLMRGAGSAGLSAMPVMAEFAKGHLMRPFLNFPRADLDAYACQCSLGFVEDKTNADLTYDRNYLRHLILPQLEKRWAGCYKTLSRAAMLQGETQELLDDYLSKDLALMAGSAKNSLSVTALQACDDVKQRALLRLWISHSGFSSPSVKKMQHIVSDALYCSSEASPRIHWSDAEVRRFRDDLFVMKCLSFHGESQEFEWGDLDSDLRIESLGVSLQSSLFNRWGEKARLAKVGVVIKFRQGGESIRLKKGGKATSLKNVFQQFSVPPWLRSRTPLVYFKDELVVVYGICQAEC